MEKMKPVQKIVLQNVKVSIVSYYALDDIFYCLKVGLGPTTQRSEQRKKQSHSAYFEFGSMEIDWQPIFDTMHIAFVEDTPGKPNIIGSSDIPMQNLQNASLEQLKPLVSKHVKVGWLYFQFRAKQQNYPKKQQYLYINSVKVQYMSCTGGHEQSIHISCKKCSRQTPPIPIINSKLQYNEQIILPVKYTEIVSVDIRCHTDEQCNKKASKVYFMVENIKRGEEGQLRIPLCIRYSNKKIGELVLEYYLDNMHMPNMDMAKTAYSDRKTERSMTPSTKNTPTGQQNLLDVLDKMLIDTVRQMKKKEEKEKKMLYRDKRPPLKSSNGRRV